MRRALPFLLAGLVAAALCLWNLGGKYLWQDEAACALLAERWIRLGKPFAWDGTNLVTMDEFRADRGAAELDRHTRDAASAVRYFAENGDFKADTTWVGQPWGQFVLAGTSLALLGHGTVPARLPFALAGVATALVLFAIARRRFGGRATAWVALFLLCGNTFWFLHVRQCRYYGSATLFLLLTFAAYLRWQEGRRFGAALFVISAWCWFQNDFGSPWPVFGVMLFDALLRREGRRGALATFAALGLALAPFVVYYELGSRLKPPDATWAERFLGTLFNANQYQFPLLALVPLAVLARKPREPEPGARRPLLLAAAILVGQYLWMPIAGPFAFYRYIVDLTPLAALVLAHLVVAGSNRLAARARRPALAPRLAAAATIVLLVTPWAALPVTTAIPARFRTNAHPGTLVRPELRAFAEHLGGGTPDPNRAAVEFLEPRLRPGDEILVAYEDLPIAFYTGHPVRGGIAAFRVRDASAGTPRFAVLRSRGAVPFLHWPLFETALKDGAATGRWRENALESPGVPWGNIPDPIGFDLLWRSSGTPPVLVLEHDPN